MSTLAIVGCGGHGRVVADCAEACGWSAIHFFDDQGPKVDLGSWRYMGAIADLLGQADRYDGAIVGVGSNRKRLELHADIEAAAGRMPPLIHPRAYVSPRAMLGPGTVVFAGAVVQPGSRIGAACIVNTSATVDHDCELDEGVHVSPGAHLAGGVRVGSLSWIGVGACVREALVIGPRVVVGAGSVVVKSIGPDAIVYGNPAKPATRSPSA